MYDIIIVGGGAAGFFAALSAAETAGAEAAGAIYPARRILILEKSEPLAKVRISGGGRCNLTHACYDPAELISNYPRGGKELHGPFTRFQPRHTIAWFEQRHIRLKTESDGRVFPRSDRSETIVACLLSEAQRLGIELRTHCGLHTLARSVSGFSLLCTNGERLAARQVLLAPGGGSASAYALARQLGHTIAAPAPSLFTFKIIDPRLKGLAGIAIPQAELNLHFPSAQPAPKAAHLAASGPLLVTHWGLSGPAVLRLSAWGARRLADNHYRAELRLNWLPAHTPETLLPLLQTARQSHLRQHSANYEPSGRLPTRLWSSLLNSVEINPAQPWGELSNLSLRRLAQELTQGQFQIQGKGPFKEEFVTCGGVELKEIDFKTMQSRLCPGLYFAGEYLDIDGLTGGFNFQAAWTTGWIAGQAMGAAGQHEPR